MYEQIMKYVDILCGIYNMYIEYDLGDRSLPKTFNH